MLGSVANMESRTKLLRILSNIDQTLAKLDETLATGCVSDNLYCEILEAVADLTECEIETLAELRTLQHRQ